MLYLCFVDGMGEGGWLGWVLFVILGMVLGIFFLLELFMIIRFSSLCMVYVIWIMLFFPNYFFFHLFFKPILFFIPLQSMLYACFLWVWLDLVVLFCLFSLPPPDPSTGQIKTWLRGYCTSYQKLTCFLLYLIINNNGKSILQVPDTGTWVLDNTRPFWRSSIVFFWMPPARSKGRKYHISGQYWYT